MSAAPPSIRSMAARIGAHSLHAQRDPRETTAKARRTFLDHFLERVDPERTLPEAERQRRAESLRKAHFARLSLASASARRKRRSKKGDDDG